MISKDLCTLASLLSNFQVCIDPKDLYDISGRSINVDYSEDFSYSIRSLVFTIDKVGGIIPCDSYDLQLKLSMSVDLKKECKEVFEDPLNNLTFDIEIFGKKFDKKENKIIDLYSTWHLDRHIISDGDGQTKYSHPYYHLTFGGRKMEDGYYDYGQCVIFPSPRLSYPPMDVILGIDFIIQNFIEYEKIKDLLLSPEYIDIVSRSQDRIWKPYYASIYSKWEKSTIKVNENFTFNKLMPFLYT